MYELVNSSKCDEKFQKLIYGIVNGSMHGQWKQYRAELSTILNWIRKTVDYRRDPYGVELVQDAWATLDRARGDCDDMVVLFCAAAETLGAPCRFVTVSVNPDKEPSHVYAEVFVDGKWTAVDCIIPWAPIGWAPTVGITDKRIWAREDVGLSGYDEPVIEGLGMHDSGPNGWADDHYNVSANGNGKDEGGFSSGMKTWNPTNVSNDVSMTYSPGVPGEVVRMERGIPSKLIMSPADPTRTPRAGGGDYYAEQPIESYSWPGDAFTTVPRSDVPSLLDPDLWTGAVPISAEDPRAMLPGPLAQEDGMAGLGQHEMVTYSDLESSLSRDEANAATSIAHNVVQDVNQGLVPSGPDFMSVLDKTINTAVGAWALSQQADIAESQAKLAQARAEQTRAAAQLITAQANVEIGVPIYKKAWFFPVVGAAAVFLFKGGAALFGGGKKKKYKRNPSNGMSKYLPLALGAGVAYWLVTKAPATKVYPSEAARDARAAGKVSAVRPSSSLSVDNIIALAQKDALQQYDYSAAAF